MMVWSSPLMSTLTLSGARGDVWGGPSAGGGKLLIWMKKKKIFILIWWTNFGYHANKTDVFMSFMSFWLKVGIRERPLLVHCLSDTGIMCYQVFWIFQRYVARNAPRAGFNFSSQGLQLATRGKLDVRGVVWDSCPGPRPEITIPRFLMVALVFNWNWVTNSDWWINLNFIYRL